MQFKIRKILILFVLCGFVFWNFTSLARAGWFDNLKTAAGLVQNFGSVSPGLSKVGVGDGRVPVFDEATKRIEKKEVGIKLPGLGKIGVSIPIPGLPGTSDDSFAWNLANMAIHKMSKEVVNWIRNGGRNGGPLFITNWEDFLKDVANEASGIFLEEFELTEVCQPFKPRLQLLIAGGGGSYRQRAQCTIRDVARNVENFYRDFKQGGWDTWFQITMVPQNNFYGSYYLALEEKLARETTAVEAQNSMAIAGGGFLGKEECVEWRTEPTSQMGRVCVKWRTVTPGTLVQDQLNDVFSSDKRRLEVADEIDEIVAAAFQRLFTSLRASKSGVLKTEKDSEDPITIFNQATQNDVSGAIQQVSNIVEVPQAIALAQQSIAIKQDSISKAETLLGLLENIDSCRNQTATSSPRVNITKNNITQLENDIENLNTLAEQLRAGEQQLAGSRNTDDVYQNFTDLKAAVDIVVSLYDSAVSENSQIDGEITSAERELEECNNPNQNTGN